MVYSNGAIIQKPPIKPESIFQDLTTKETFTVPYFAHPVQNRLGVDSFRHIIQLILLLVGIS